MSGRDSQKRRKRRRTRAERNMSRSLVNKPQQDQKNRSSKKEQLPKVAAANPGITYAMRSGKGASMFVPTNYKTATSGTITQSRMTTAQRMLTNYKSSDWIKRGPIPETEAVKKKVESDLKRILNFAEANRSNNYVYPSVSSDVLEKSQEHSSHSGAEPSAMEVDVPALSSQTLTNSHKVDASSKKSHQPRERCSKTNEIISTTTITPVGSSSMGIKKQQTPGRTASSCESTFSSPVKDDEYLEPEVPVKATGEKLLKELKTKIVLMFPNRDIQRELSYDLHKLVKQSSSNITAKDIETAIPFTDTLLCTPGVWTRPKSMVNSTLSAFRPSEKNAPTGEAKVCRSPPEVGVGNNPQLMGRSVGINLLPQIEKNKSCGLSNSEQAEEEELGAVSFCPDSIVMKDSGTDEPIIRIVTAASDSSSSEGCGADDELGGLTAACCDAFIADARDLQKQHQQGLQQNRSQISWPHNYRCSMLNSTASSETHYSWMDISACVTDQLPTLSCSSSSNQIDSTVASGGSNHYRGNSSCHFSNLANIASCAICRQGLVHQLPPERPASFGSNSTTSGLFLLREETHDSGRAGRCHPPLHMSLHPNQRELSSSRSERSEIFSLRCGKNTSSFSRFENFHDTPRGSIKSGANSGSSVGLHDNGASNITRRRVSHQLGPHIIQSRQNLQTALDSACRDSGVDLSLKASDEPTDKGEIFSSMFEQAQSSLLSCGPNPNTPWQQYRRSQTNQVDMQRQARDFLDDLEKNSESKQAISSKLFPQPLFGNVSSASDASLMAKSSSRLKDLPLKAASFM